MTNTPRHRRAIRLDQPLTMERVLRSAAADALGHEWAEWSRRCEKALAEITESPGSSTIDAGRFTVVITSDARLWLIDGAMGFGHSERGVPAFVVGLVCAALHDRSATPTAGQAEAAMRLLAARLHECLPMSLELAQEARSA